MRKILLLLLIIFPICNSVKAETLKFNYNINADLVSCYIWRGQYNGGLSFQPDLAIGWESEHTSLSFGTWWSVGASDWGFRSGLPKTEDNDPNTKLTKEVDLHLDINLWGAIIGATHYYYFDGKNFFNFGSINSIKGSAQTEVTVGYDFSTLFPKVDLQILWNTTISGDDAQINGNRCHSTYIETTYHQHFNHDWVLTGVVGFSPWKGNYTDIKVKGKERDFAFNNITLRLDKTWSFKKCTFSAFVQGTMNTCNLSGSNAIIHASGDNKLEKQKLMGALGINISF